MKKLVSLVIAIVCFTSVACSPSRRYIEHRVVHLVSSNGSCTGTQIRAQSGKDYILSAGHCADLQNQRAQILVVTDSGDMLSRAVLDVNLELDLMLLEGIPGMKGLPLADSAMKGQEVISYTHGHGLPIYSARGILGDVGPAQIAELIGSPMEFFQCMVGGGNPVSDGEQGYCVKSYMLRASSMPLLGGASGGAILNMRGQVIGVAESQDEHTHDGFLVDIKEIKSFLAQH
jgi:hypothetical protein